MVRSHVFTAGGPTKADAAAASTGWPESTLSMATRRDRTCAFNGRCKGGRDLPSGLFHFNGSHVAFRATLAPLNENGPKPELPNLLQPPRNGSCAHFRGVRGPPDGRALQDFAKRDETPADSAAPFPGERDLDLSPGDGQ